ncbi:MAG: bifunctional adenosylcobinamide kinase/adenosylcobinamide-phosphate guanylyltransferase [Lachnospiraceae bacterium]|jgi:adenosylcobinamide kinase/adenosylcobinamide-phosphate guanylyltransferase|nr:bifunctional adenosylcobinamide kinase/adenosylcobinamide-phosphate guanylyltransferase [Lachnospiraceae bacterium]
MGQMILVIGGSASGKSAFAEKLAKERESGGKIYIATMKPCDAECKERIRKHRERRKEADYETVECFGRSLMEARRDKHAGKTGLFECMSNYASNVMFGDYDPFHAVTFTKEKLQSLSEEMVSELSALNDRLEELIIVTNDVFSDGNVYDEMTMSYLALLGLCNQKLADKADQVYEVVCGIAVRCR